MDSDSVFCVYGAPDPELAAVPGDARQVSPLFPGAAALEDLPPASCEGMVMAAPAGTLERRYVLALGLRALKTGAPLTVMAPKDKGGSRLTKELEAFGCAVDAAGKRHQRICRTSRPETLSVSEAIEAGQPRFADALGLWTQPGIFSWDRPDPGTELLRSVLLPLERVQEKWNPVFRPDTRQNKELERDGDSTISHPALAGRGADLGCGLGVLAAAVLTNPGVTHLDLTDIDRRAVEAARRNVPDPRATFHWADVRQAIGADGLDFVVMNPPFHDGGIEDKGLGLAFVRRGHQMLRAGGKLWLVANRHLPYEGVLTPLFSTVTLRADSGGFKVYEAQK
ncbi:MAG: class I SAM-dependent methyltransferase [Rhodospirillaceae bacterium]